MIISHLMTTHVIVASPMDSLKSAARILEENDFDALPICDNNRLIGMLTVRDIALKALENGLPLEETKVADYMTFEAKYVFSDQTAEFVTSFMAEQQLRRVLVLDRDYHLVGIVSVDDLAVANTIKETFLRQDSSFQAGPHEWPDQVRTARKKNSFPDLAHA